MCMFSNITSKKYTIGIRKKIGREAFKIQRTVKRSDDFFLSPMIKTNEFTNGAVGVIIKVSKTEEIL